ncbi:Bifunctional inhibitor/plant lipid transfer protein/seed storage helical domain [Dillenia turbinata]|uniref:Bifunctional inhibitor/plant lipid transfer protein/seed storage helical domain n=1 Tax=Dillenia turbinata TaxID=194707 RepID=A0AAN8UV47_9MAGN
MDSKLVLVSSIVLFSSSAFVGFAQLDLLFSGSGDTLPCVQKLAPCRPYLKSSSMPPATCCAPLKEMVSDDRACLCSIFNDPEILKSLNITQDQALQLPRSCGANPDISKCNNGVVTKGTAANPPSSSPSTPLAPPTPSDDSGTSDNKSSSAARMSFSCQYGSIAFFGALITLAL